MSYSEQFLRERANSYYSPFAWLASRVVLVSSGLQSVLSDGLKLTASLWQDIIPLRIVPTIIVSCIVYWMVGLHHDAAAFFKFLLILILFNITTTLWNLFLAASIAEPGVAILVSSVVNLFQMVRGLACVTPPCRKLTNHPRPGFRRLLRQPRLDPRRPSLAAGER